MNRNLIPGIVLALAAPISFAQTPQPPATPVTSSAAPSGEMHLEPGVALRVELAKTIDAKKAKSGDPVVAKTVDELMAGTRVAAPRGSKVFGHVVSATPHKGDTPSTLEIAFDRIELGPENQVPMKAVVRALSQPVEIRSLDSYGSGPAGGASMGSPMGSPSGGRMGGGTPPTASTPNNGGLGNDNSNPGASSASTTGRIPLDARGVIGISDISLSAGSQGDTTITSQKHNVKLESGTQMILKIAQ
ncbi:MAG TPA: hypothetical protein VMB18_15880 [Terriglobales bacterium]|nr:hypothetical protein [Terriglobales bacterium]